jgi:glutathione S-transferase
MLQRSKRMSDIATRKSRRPRANLRLACPHPRRRVLWIADEIGSSTTTPADRGRDAGTAAPQFRNLNPWCRLPFIETTQPQYRSGSLAITLYLARSSATAIRRWKAKRGPGWTSWALPQVHRGVNIWSRVPSAATRAGPHHA